MNSSSRSLHQKTPVGAETGSYSRAWRLGAAVIASLLLTALLAWSMSAAPPVSPLQSPITTPSVTPTPPISATPTATPNPGATTTPSPSPTPERLISGTVYLDANRNQTLDADEHGLQGVYVSLSVGDELSAETRTDDRGRFQFVDMSPGYWWLWVDVPLDMEFTSIGSNPLLVIVGNYALLDIPFGLALLPPSTPTPIVSTTPGPPSTASPRGWLPFVAGQDAYRYWLPVIVAAQ